MKKLTILSFGFTALALALSLSACTKNAADRNEQGGVQKEDSNPAPGYGSDSGVNPNTEPKQGDSQSVTTPDAQNQQDQQDQKNQNRRTPAGDDQNNRPSGGTNSVIDRAPDEPKSE